MDYMDAHHHYASDRMHPTKDGALQVARAVYSGLTETEAHIDEYPVSDTGVVYVNGSANGEGDGKTPESAIKVIGQAVSLLRESGGTIVICGPTVIDHTCYLPKNNERITITSVYNGVDYRVTAGARIDIKHHIFIHGDLTFDDVELRTLAKNLVFVCNYNDVTIGEGVSCTIESGTGGYMLLVVGCNPNLGGEAPESVTLYDECNVNVNGGTWVYVRVGNRRAKPELPLDGIAETGKLTVTINGGTFTNAGGSNLLSATGMNNTYGESNLIINGGTFKGPVYAVSRIGDIGTGDEAERGCT